MKLSLIDIGITLAYLFTTICIGLILSKRAQQNKKDHMLGGYKHSFNLEKIKGLHPVYSVDAQAFAFEGYREVCDDGDSDQCCFPFIVQNCTTI